ncbi:MAG: hypothetical protein BSR46_13755 [Candidatus Dactylopiibacterium carminicum]|nr:DUF4124 domain-containing protein [Candidatus Dactylopiibacterium carminicum]PAS97406.1 MAG: hypothetical protein BSR46_13755 [Candidatus Dactylopiibacterium carminicum]
MKSRALSFLLLATFSLGVNAQIYTWKDANGRTHFSDQPPTGVEARTTRGKTSPPQPQSEPAASEPSASASGPRGWQEQDKEFRERRAKQAEDAAKAKEEAAAKAEKAQYCDSLRRNLTLMERGGRVGMPTAGGETEIMSDAQLKAEAERLRTQLARDCR